MATRKRSSYAAAAQKVLANRVNLVETAGKAYEEIQRLEADYTARIAEARQAYATAYDAAAAGGWTRDQLAEVNLPVPEGRKAPRRRPGAAAAAGKSASDKKAAGAA